MTGISGKGRWQSWRASSSSWSQALFYGVIETTQKHQMGSRSRRASRRDLLCRWFALRCSAVVLVNQSLMSRSTERIYRCGTTFPWGSVCGTPLSLRRVGRRRQGGIYWESFLPTPGSSGRETPKLDVETFRYRVYGGSSRKTPANFSVLLRFSTLPTTPQSARIYTDNLSPKPMLSCLTLYT